MKFEIGKKYLHETGMLLSVLGELETTWWGKTLIGEMISLSRDVDKKVHSKIELIPLNDEITGLSKDWEKISNYKWMSYFNEEK